MSKVERKLCAYSYPVSIKKAPTPPIHPTRICLGKNPTRAPNLSAPSKKNVRPIQDIEISL